jgi:hypothetical protein
MSRSDRIERNPTSCVGLLHSDCGSTRQSGIRWSRSMPVSSRSWRSAMCPELKFSLAKCQPDTGHWPHRLLHTGMTAEIRKAALQFTSTESHCRNWQRKSLGQDCSVKRRPPMPAMRRSNCVILGALNPPFVWASNPLRFSGYVA